MYSGIVVYYPFIKHHKLKRRVELKERKKPLYDNNQLHTTYIAIVWKKRSNLCNFISITTFMEKYFIHDGDILFRNLQQ